MALNIKNPSPCLCALNGPITTTSNCVKICDIIIPEGPDPCGGTQTVDVTLSDNGHDTTACGSDLITWYVIDFDTTVFESVTITPSGMLTYASKSTTKGSELGCITIQARCGELGGYGGVYVILNNLCNTVNCPGGQLCDPCTGGCVSQDTLITSSVENKDC